VMTGLDGFVEPLFMTSEEARRSFNRPIRLIFIDGDHSYISTKRDIELWKDLVVDGGAIVLHDINWATVAQAVDETIRTDKSFTIEGTTGCSLLVSKGRSLDKALFDEIALFNAMKGLLSVRTR
jgi:hypothetical protein